MAKLPLNGMNGSLIIWWKIKNQKVTIDTWPKCINSQPSFKYSWKQILILNVFAVKPDLAKQALFYRSLLFHLIIFKESRQ